ncbi:neprilysin-1-like [Arctopsyche grandis]|uniref:neprilysin-1-like n=1 Tax=Arctopsyche grandis TaxID=121162 RepID=UPI00406D7C1B
MDLPTKKVTIEKVRSMKSLIGFPDWLFEPGKLEEYYEGVKTDPKIFLENRINLLELRFNNKIKNFRKQDESGWGTNPTDVSAFYTREDNTINAFNTHVFYLRALNYGALGNILGHELTHGFDNEGRKYDKDGKLYSSFYVPEVGEYLNGNLTLSENIADNGGLKSSLRAYWKERENVEKLLGLPVFNGDQLFFLSYVNSMCSIKYLNYNKKDVHSPLHLRVKGNLQNMPEFARAWKCPLNSTMNPLPHIRCILF